jgi:benzoate transport
MDPRTTLLERPMSPFQIIAIILCVALNALDGFDVLSISFASPGIASEWGIDRGALGIVLSMELIGMGFGSVLLGSVADRIGRRPTILGCLVLMAAGMLAVTSAHDVVTLSIYRLVTGLGIGGMLAAINAMAAEYANRKRRPLAVAIMAAGYPIGAVVGGSIASLLLASHDWRAVFLFGASITASFIPLIWLLMPESIEFLVHKRPPGALEKINRTLARMGHPASPALPDALPDAPRASFAALFAPGLATLTILLTAAYFFHVMTFYFILKWIPKIVVDMGFAPSAAGGVLVWANVGGASGALLFGLLAQKIDLRRLTITCMLVSTAMVILFGRGQAGLSQLALIAGIAGFFTNAVIIGLYAMFAQIFPTHLRAGGTGFAVGIGRAGAALGPVIAGYLFQAGYGLAGVAIAMSLGSFAAAIILTALGSRAKPAEA